MTDHVIKDMKRRLDMKRLNVVICIVFLSLALTNVSCKWERNLSTDESKQVENETYTKDASLTQGKTKQQREAAGLVQDYLALELADSGTLEECCRFLIKCPDSRFRKAVIGRVKWLQAEENGSHAKYRVFLKNNPKSIYAAKARLRLKQLAIMENWNKFKE